MSHKLMPETEERANTAALAVACPQPRCGAEPGKHCRETSDRGARCATGSAHLGRVKAAGALDMLPMVAAWVRGQR